MSFSYWDKPPAGSLLDRTHPLAQGLVGGWLFNEQSGNRFFDISGQNHGTYTGTSGTDWLTRRVEPEVGMTVGGNSSIANSNYRIDLGSVNSKHPLSLSGGNTMTMAFQISHIDSGTLHDFPRLFDKSDGASSANGYGLAAGDNGSREGQFYIAGTLRSRTNDAAAGDFFTFDPMHGAVVRDGGTVRWYKNGELFFSDSTGYTTNFSTATTNAAIFNWNHTTNREWEGYIGYLYIYNRALAQAEVFDIMNQPYQFMYPPRALGIWFAAAAGAGWSGIVTGVTDPGKVGPTDSANISKVGPVASA